LESDVVVVRHTLQLFAWLSAAVATGSGCSPPATTPGAPPEPGAAWVAPTPAAAARHPVEALLSPSPLPLAGPVASIAGPIDPPSRRSRCNEQAPQERLIRSSYLVKPGMPADEVARRRDLHRAAVEYRTREYGFSGHGDAKWNALEPKHYAKTGSFFGIRVTLNNRVLTALGCVEETIAERCAETPYTPEVLDGLRGRNTFHNDEVSNHMFGIAIDIDPNKNSCCGCVPPLSEWPRCKVPVSTVFERTTIPRCWVDSFERYGFYWLGKDELEDTMHFEFLGDPDAIIRGD